MGRKVVILRNIGDIWKICEKDGGLFATYSFTNSTFDCTPGYILDYLWGGEKFEHNIDLCVTQFPYKTLDVLNFW